MVELRRYERVQFLGRLELSAGSDGPKLEARSIDLGLGGVGAVTKAVLEVGQPITVTFFLRDARGGDVRDQVAGRVIHFRADFDVNTVGIEFLTPLSEAEHPRLVEKLMSL